MTAHPEEVYRKVLDRMRDVEKDRQRWQLLVEAVVAMSADLSLDDLLRRIVRSAAELSGARYAALGVLDEDKKKHLRLFITHGMDEEQIRDVGDFPTGHGLLGLIIERPEPLRLHDIAAHPSSYGFPPNHPPMTSFLGVPIRSRGRVFGNLYLTEKEGSADFSGEDEQIVVALAAAAGVAIANADLYDALQRREAWLTATAEITSLLASSEPSAQALQVIVDRARELSGADVTWMVSAHDEGRLALEVVSGATTDADAVAGLDLRGSLAHMVVESGVPARTENLSLDRSVVDIATELGWEPLGPAVMVPLRSRSGTAGVLALGWTVEHRSGIHRLDTTLPERFAEHAALALEIARSARDERQLVLLEDRDRIARDLHDVVIQRLFAAGLGLQSGIRPALSADAAVRLDGIVDELDASIQDIRRTIFALGIMGVEGADLQTEVTRVVDRAATTLKFRPGLSLEGPVRTAVPEEVAAEVLAVLGELLSNAARHAGAHRVDVGLVAGDDLALRVSDDGRGMPANIEESGLANVRERASRLGGTCEVRSQPGRGTSITWCIPLQS